MSELHKEVAKDLSLRVFVVIFATIAIFAALDYNYPSKAAGPGEAVEDHLRSQ